jgi:hypothetical protein
MTRFSINSILWFGEDMKRFGGIVPGDDEEFLSCIYPAKVGKSNAWNGDAIIAHFAFFTQREELDRQGILEQYGQYLFDVWEQDVTMKPINDNIQKVMTYIQDNEASLLSQPSPYMKVNRTLTLRDKVKRCIPKFILDQVQAYKQMKALSQKHIIG